MNNLTIEEYLKEIKISLRNQKSLLSEFIIGSNVYIIFRAISETLSKRDIRVNSVVDSLSLLTASANNLDTIGRRYNLKRNTGTKATGSILIESFIGEVPKGTVFETLDSTKQYVVTESTLTDNINIRAIPVEATNIGPDYNLSPGTSLKSLSSAYGLYIKVGFNLVQGRYTGSIDGGEAMEDDTSYRIRLLNLLQQGFLVQGSYLDLLTAIAETIPSTDFYIIEDYPVPSVFTVFVDSITQSIENSIIETIDSKIPIGVRYQIQPLSYDYIDVEINIIATTDSDLDSIRSTIINLVNMYFGSRSVGQSFIKNDLIGVINSNVTVNSLTIPYPLLNIVPTASNKKIKLNNINISLSK